MYIIEQGYKPIKNVSKGRSHTYPFEDMKVGDSFIAGPYTRNAQSSLMGCIANFIKRYHADWQIISRKHGKDLRVFRTK